MLFAEFFNSEKSSGVVLIGCTLVSLSLANSGLADSYVSLWAFPVAGHEVAYWINDGLMTLFFLMVGLEIEREIYVGELSRPRNALLPIVAALGGMLIPALLHFSMNTGKGTQAGFGIPMATDIAFALGVLSLVGNRVPTGLKVFLAALAIIDDLGAIVMIALFYTKGASLVSLLVSASIIAVLAACNRFKVKSLPVYLIGGAFLWYFIHQSGVHPTITGVILAFLVPFGKGNETSPSYKLQHGLHYSVAFLVLPLFALANTSLTISGDWYASLLEPNSLGIVIGLVLGKLVGISLFSYLAVKIGLSVLPTGVDWKQIVSVSILGGIGFTMSIFITLLAFEDAGLVQQSKIAILAASLIAGLIGYGSLRLSLRTR